jgi:hypothetical protein
MADAPQAAEAATPEAAILTPAQLSEYLKAEAGEEVGTPELPKPYLSATGRLFVHTRHLTSWLQANVSPDVKQSDAQKLLRDLGMVHRATPLPGFEREGKPKRAAFYQAKTPIKGLTLTGVAQRKAAPKKAAPKKAAPKSAPKSSAKKSGRKAASSK